MIELAAPIQRALCATFLERDNAFLCIETVVDPDTLATSVRAEIRSLNHTYGQETDPIGSTAELAGHGDTPETALAALAEVLAGIEATKGKSDAGT